LGAVTVYKFANSSRRFGCQRLHAMTISSSI
jgi:hypothetical protein